MKKLATLCVALLFVMSNAAVAQTCCNSSGTTVAPEIQTGFYTTSQIAFTANTPNPVLSVNGSADLPTTEYIITKRNTPAMMDDGNGNMVPDTTGGGGDVIIGADVDGVFMPGNMSRYGIVLNAGDTFDLTAIGYDLNLVKILADSLLNGTSGSNECCDLFTFMSIALGQPALAGFCDSVNSAGIFDADDITDMNDVLSIFDVFASGSTSLGTMVWTLQTINANGSFIDQECGGTGLANFLPYGIKRNAKYGYDAEGTIAVQKLSDVSLFMMYPNPTANGIAKVYFTTQKEVDLTINVYDALGQRVHSQTLGNVSGSFDTNIQTADFASGMYHVELTDGYSSQTQKLIVQ